MKKSNSVEKNKSKLNSKISTAENSKTAQTNVKLGGTIKGYNSVQFK